MKVWAACGLAWCCGIAAFAKPTIVDGGCFTLSLEIDPLEWLIDPHPERNFVRLGRIGGPGLRPGTAFGAHVFVDRIGDAVVPVSVEAWFSEYLKRTTGFLRSNVFPGPRSFRPGKGNPITISGKTLFRFEMVRQILNRPASGSMVEEEAVVYFLVPPDFENHKSFFVFAGRQILSRDLGHRSELGELEKLIAGFALSPASKG